MGDKLTFQNINILKLLSDARKQKNLTLRALSEMTSYSYQSLSKYEIGLRDLNQENLHTLAQCLDIDLESVFYIEDKLDEDLNDLFESIIYDNEKEIERLIHQVRIANPYIFYSQVKNQYLTIFYILYILGLHNDLDSYQYVIKNIHLFEIELKQLYYDYKAIEYLKNNQIHDAVNTIDCALQYENRESSAGLIHYHASLIYTYYGKLNKALSLSEIAEDYFLKTRNLKRLTHMQIHSASINAKLGHFRTSQKMYKRILSTILDTETKIVILYNLAWFSFLNKEYKDSLEYLKQIELEQALSENGIFIKCSCLYQLNQTQAANQLYQNTISSFNDPMYKLEMEIIQCEYTENKTELEIKLLQLHSMTKDSRNFENYEFVLDRLIAYYENHSKYKIAIVYYKEKITLMNWMYSN